MRERVKAAREKVPIEIVGHKCHAVFCGKRCPECGYVYQRVGSSIDTLDGRLLELRAPKKADEKPTIEEQRRWYAMFRYQCRVDGYKSGYACHAYHKKWGKYPSTAWAQDDPLPPTPDVVSYSKYLRIRAAKAFANSRSA